MARLKTRVILFMFLLEQFIQTAVSSENSEIGTEQTGYVPSIQHCFNKKPKMLMKCMLKHAILNVENAIASNDKWHLNKYVSLKKNLDWKPVEIEARDFHNIFSVILKKLSDLLTSRSLQFSIPQLKQQQYQYRQARSGYNGQIPNLDDVQFADGSYAMEEGAGQSDGTARNSLKSILKSVIFAGRKKNKNKHGGGMAFGGFAMVAMMAQLFLGKIAFLAGASLLLTKIALLFSVVNALKKQTSSSSGEDHVVYTDQGHGNQWQRSIPDSLDWSKNLLK